jgi:hypothetical protein
MERRLGINDPDAAKVPFVFAVGDSVRLRSDHSLSGTIKNGWFEGEYDAGSFKIWYEIETQNSQLIRAEQLELEKVTED